MNVGKFILNIVVAFVAYGALYSAGEAIFADQFATGMAMMNPQDTIMVPVLGYHLVQTVVVVWLFGKAVGSGDLKAGAMFGFMIGLYLLASDNNWFTMLKDFPQGARLPIDILHLVNGALVGMLLAFMWGKGWGAGAAEASEG